MKRMRDVCALRFAWTFSAADRQRWDALAEAQLSRLKQLPTYQIGVILNGEGQNGDLSNPTQLPSAPEFGVDVHEEDGDNGDDSDIQAWHDALADDLGLDDLEDLYVIDDAEVDTGLGF